MIGSPLAPHYHSGRAGEQLWEQLVEVGWWLIAARIAIGLARLLVVLEGQAARDPDHLGPAGRRDLRGRLPGNRELRLHRADTRPARHLRRHRHRAGPRVAEHPVRRVLGHRGRPGEAVQVGRPALGWKAASRVTWCRSTGAPTQIATGQSNIAVVPNSIIAKARLVNRSAPTPMRGDSIEVRLDANAIPEQCLNALLSATRACRLLRATPLPSVACTGLQGDGAIYEISFSVDSSEELSKARTELFAQVPSPPASCRDRAGARRPSRPPPQGECSGRWPSCSSNPTCSAPSTPGSAICWWPVSSRSGCSPATG